MFRNLIPALSDRYRVIAPDYPGYGQSDMPDHTKFDYTFDRYGAQIARIAQSAPVIASAILARPHRRPPNRIRPLPLNHK